MPKLYFGSRGGVYYWKGGRKVYVGSFGMMTRRQAVIKAIQKCRESIKEQLFLLQQSQVLNESSGKYDEELENIIKIIQYDLNEELVVEDGREIDYYKSILENCRVCLKNNESFIKKKGIKWCEEEGGLCEDAGDENASLEGGSMFGKKLVKSRERKVRMGKNLYGIYYVDMGRVFIFDRKVKRDSDPQQSAYYRSIGGPRKVTKDGTFMFRKKKYNV